MRANSISNPGVALNRELPSNFDDIKALAEIAGEIAELAPYSAQIATLVAALPDVTTVQEASDLINNLSVTVETLPEGSTATVVLTGTNVHFGIPKGSPGENGLSPNIELSYNEETGNLEYEITSWSDKSGALVAEEIMEW